jgi:hypothetical protein
MIKRVILVIVGFVVVVAVLAVIKVKQIQAAIAMGASMAPPPPAVSTTVAEQDLWPRHLFAVGTHGSRPGRDGDRTARRAGDGHRVPVRHDD